MFTGDLTLFSGVTACERVPMCATVLSSLSGDEDDDGFLGLPKGTRSTEKKSICPRVRRVCSTNSVV
jgi:hypothetical protein